MQAVVIDRYGDNGVVRIGAVPEPSLRPRDVLIEVRAASVNPVDVKIRSGALRWVLRSQMPLVLGSDLSGVVRATGPEVSRFAPGDEVYARLDKGRPGALAELAAVDEEHVARKPARLSHVEAASLPLVGLTAWQALVDEACVRPGQSVLIHAGTGGVGTIAIQLARHLGVSVTATASASGADLLRDLGADRVIDYRTERFEAVTGGHDMVFDTLGGETRARSFRTLRRGGVMVSIAGHPTPAFARANGMPLPLVLAVGALHLPTWARARSAGVRFEFLFMRPSGEQLARLADLVDRGEVRPVLDQTLPFARAAEALARVESGRARGKVVVEIGR
jgi:NADPH:quinone reductase-like Zn-dependent oxidoreductase